MARLLRQAGVDRLSAVVATHASADHHGGLAEVLRRFPVELLVDGGDGTAEPGFRQVLADGRARGIPIQAARAGQELRAGGIEIRVLSPAPRPPGPAPEDPNPRAVVAIVSSGNFELMLSADAESPTLAALDLPDVDAIKVPHHGSADAGLGEVLQTLRPEVAVVEVGENSYGHPHPDTLRSSSGGAARPAHGPRRDGAAGRPGGRLELDDARRATYTRGVADRSPST